MKRLLALLMALALAALLGTVLEAKRPGSGGGKGEAPVKGVIIALDSTAMKMKWYQFEADDGSVSREIICGGDLTHNIDENRYFVFTRSAEEPAKIFVSPYEDRFQNDCSVWAWKTENLNHIPIRPRWSLDGKRVTYTGITYNADGTQSYGIWVVKFDEQSGLEIPHETNIDVDPYSPLSPPSFLPDLPDADGCNCWVTYSGYTNNEYGIWVANLDTGNAFNVTRNLSISGSHPAFSPVDGDYRLAFIRNTNTGGGSIINHIFVSTLEFHANSNPTIEDITQVTSKKNANLAQISNPSWSPDGKHLLFSGTDLSADIDFDIYRIRADGKGKAVLLTDGSPEPDLFWTGGHWRKSP
jgi:hypothetical protein